ncbi:MAG: hypothetical protein U1F24_04085 [Alphaproteobacteria bacterium]
MQIGNPPPPAKGFIRAWDPVTQTERWSVPMAGAWNGGLLTTAGGLVFGFGGADGVFGAYDAGNRRPTVEDRPEDGILAPPVTFSVDGERCRAAGRLGRRLGPCKPQGPDRRGGEDRHQSGPSLRLQAGQPSDRRGAPRPTRGPQEKPPAVTGDAATIEKGFVLFHQTCTVCHGFFAESAGVVPDLRLSTPDVFSQYKDIVLDGALAANGRPRSPTI